ncbi:outer membrane protein assembly factor BamA [Thiolapillus sp.]
MRIARYIFASLFALMLAMPVVADSFVVKDIRVEGLQRISAGTVFNYLPVKPGDTIDAKTAPAIIRALYKTGFFKDVRLERDGQVLNIIVQERPAIAQIDITGNKSIKTEDLEKGLADIGLAEGRTFNRSVLDKIEQELRRQFFNSGKYGVQLQTEVIPLERNRVAVKIKIREGDTARIRGINIIGNKTFSDEELETGFQSKVGGWFAWFTKEDQYSRQKLAGDLELLKSFYLDRGYLNFRVDSTQVTISPDKKGIFITINVNEGDIYTIGDVKITGKLIVDPEEYFPLIHLRRGEPFSRRKVVDSTDRITDKLSEMGYAFANVNHIPEIDEEKKTVSITYFMDPGKRVYVRRIDVKGNTRTRDRVVRREMRQMENTWMSNSKLTLSRERLRRLGFFEDVTIETPSVPGSTDLTDVLVTVKEKPSGSLAGGLGYSGSQGISFSASITEDNFLGTGKKVTLAANTSSYNTRYQLSYFNPYATINGVSRGFNLSYQKTDYNELNISDYLTDTSEASVNYGVPLSDFNRLRMKFAIENIDLTLGALPPLEIIDFVNREGDNYLNFKLTGSWSHDSRDSAIFPTVGTSQSFSTTVTIPGSDLQFYKLSYRYRQYVPLYRRFVFAGRAILGYGDSYGKTHMLPFFENYFAGGEKTVRGFKNNTLGPRDSTGDPLGGNIKLVGGLELYSPPPFAQLDSTVRMSVFLDAGNVFQDRVELDEIRYSVGIGATWLSPMGAMTLSYGVPLNDKSYDDVENFQFSFGSVF